MLGIQKKYRPTLVVLLAGALLGGLSLSLMMTSLPNIIQDFGVSTSLGQWATTIFTLVMAVTFPISAFFIGRFSSRSLFLFCMGIYLAGSLIGLFATSFFVLLAGRFLQAAATGMVQPVAQVSLMNFCAPEKKGSAMGVYSLVMAFSPAIGPSFAGVLNDAFGWRSTFVFTASVAAAVILAGLFVLKNTSERQEGHLDIPSFLLSCIGLFSLLYGITRASDYGLAAPMVWAPVGFGALLIAVFARRQLRIDHPMLEIRLFANKDFLMGTIVIALVAFHFTAPCILLPIYIQSYRGFPAAVSGLFILPGAVIMGISYLQSGRMMDRYGLRPLCIVGTLGLILGNGSMIFLGENSPLWLMSALWVFRYVGLGFLYTPAFAWCISVVERRYAAHATAIDNAVNKISDCFGSALSIMIYGVSMGFSGLADKTAAGIFGIQIAFIFMTLMAFASLFFVVRLPRRHREI